MLGRKMIYVRYINCSYNYEAKGIRLLDKKAFVYTGKIRASKSFWKIYPPKAKLKQQVKSVMVIKQGLDKKS